MSWVTIIWSMVAAASMTLAGVHLLVWLNRRTTWASFWFSLAAVSIAVTAAGEFLMMRSATAEEFGTMLRWTLLPAAGMIVGIIGFVQVSFGTGRWWLIWTAVGLRLVTLILNFTTGQTAIHHEIIALREIQFLGEPVSVVASAVASPWVFMTTLSNLALLVYVIDAALRLWRLGGTENRGRALRLGGSVVGFVLLAAGLVALINHQVIQAPYLISLPFVIIVLVMNFELSRDLLNSITLEHDLQQTQFQLRDSEERLRLAAEAVGMGFWSRDLKSDAFWATAGAKSILKLDPDALVTFATFQSNLHPDDRPALEAGMAAAMEGQGGFRAECRLILPDGELSWISIRGDVTAHREDRPSSLTGIVVDISERRRSELEIARQRRELGHLARVNMLGELSGSIAHELNQPLTAILSNAQAAQNYLAGDSADLKEVREILTDIVTENKRASQIIRGLRSLLKRDQDDPSASEVNEMNEVVLEVLKLMRSDFLNHGVTVHTELASGLPFVRGDRVQLQQVLINLLMNACDAMAQLPPADRQVRLSTGIDVGGGVYVSVTDRGPGIPPDKLERIFEPFYTNKPSGMGLGLAVCRTIVSAHSGRLWATNSGEGGATFHLTLPGKRLAPAERSGHGGSPP